LRSLARTVGIFVIPMVASSPAVGLLWWLGSPPVPGATASPLASFGTWGDVLLLLLGSPTALAVSVALTSVLMPSTRADLKLMLAGALRKFTKANHAA
jgi:hypothetical protein